MMVLNLFLDALYLPSPFIAFLSTWASVSGSMEGGHLMVPCPISAFTLSLAMSLVTYVCSSLHNKNPMYAGLYSQDGALGWEASEI